MKFANTNEAMDFGEIATAKELANIRSNKAVFQVSFDQKIKKTPLKAGGLNELFQIATDIQFCNECLEASTGKGRATWMKS